MNLYAIIRRNGWKDSAELEAAAERSNRVNDEMDDVRWVRSYVLSEDKDAFGTVCIYEATDPEAIRTHAERSDLPIDEIVPVADTVVAGPDPQPAGG